MERILLKSFVTNVFLSHNFWLGGQNNNFIRSITSFNGTVDSAYLQVVFVRENIPIKQSARLPESPIQTGSLTRLQMQTILSFYKQTSTTGTSIIYFYFFVK